MVKNVTKEAEIEKDNETDLVAVLLDLHFIEKIQDNT